MTQMTSVKVGVYAFGIARDILGQRQMEMSIPEGSTVREFKQLLVQKYPAFRDINGFHVAIGDEYAGDDDGITALDQLSILPPVSGG